MEIMAAAARNNAASKPPAGLERTILHRLVDSAGAVEAYVGETLVRTGWWEGFVERPEQVASDVAGGYTYKVGDTAFSVGADGRLMVGSDPLDAIALPAPPTGSADEGLSRSEESCASSYASLKRTASSTRSNDWWANA